MDGPLFPDVRDRSYVHIHLASSALPPWSLMLTFGVHWCHGWSGAVWIDSRSVCPWWCWLMVSHKHFYFPQILLCRMSIHRCDHLEADVESSQIQWRLSTVHLDCSVRCSSHRSTTYPQRLHLDYIQSLKDVVSSRVVSDRAVINSGSDGGSVGEHQCCLVSSLSLACDIPHRVDDWLAFWPRMYLICCNFELCSQGRLWITINSMVFKDGLGNYVK